MANSLAVPYQYLDLDALNNEALEPKPLTWKELRIEEKSKKARKLETGGVIGPGKLEIRSPSSFGL